MFPLPPCSSFSSFAAASSSSSAAGSSTSRGPVFASTESRLLCLESLFESYKHAASSQIHSLSVTVDGIQTVTNAATYASLSQGNLISALQHNVSEQAQEISALQQNVSQREQEISALQQNVSEQAQEITALQQNVSQREQEITALQQRNETISSTMHALIQHMSTVQTTTDTAIQDLTNQSLANTSNIAITTEQMQDTIASVFIVSKHASKLEEKQRACEAWAAKAEAVLRSNIGATSDQVYEAKCVRAISELPQIQSRVATNNRLLLREMVPQLKREFNITNAIDESANRLKSKWFPQRPQHPAPLTYPTQPAAERAAHLQARAEAAEVQIIEAREGGWRQPRSAPVAVHAAAASSNHLLERMPMLQ